MMEPGRKTTAATVLNPYDLGGATAGWCRAVSGTSNEWQAVHGAGGVSQSIQDPVRRNQLLRLTHDATAH